MAVAERLKNWSQFIVMCVGKNIWAEYDGNPSSSGWEHDKCHAWKGEISGDWESQWDVPPGDHVSLHKMSTYSI